MRLRLKAETKVNSAGMTLSRPGSTIVLRLDGREIARLLADHDQIDHWRLTDGQATVHPRRNYTKERRSIPSYRAVLLVTIQIRKSQSYRFII